MIHIIKDIEFKILNNKAVHIYVDSLSVASKLEKCLVKNGCLWMNGETHINLRNINYININYSKKLTYCNNYGSSNYDIHINLDENNIDYFVKNLFIKSPDYNPKK